MTDELIDADGVTPSGVTKDEKAGLIATIQDERQKRQSVEQNMLALQQQVQNLTAQMDAQPVKDAAPQPLTDQELRAAVDRGAITEEELHSIQRKQDIASVRAEIETQVNTRVTGMEQSQVVNAEIDKYKSAVPELSDTNSESFRKVRDEYNMLLRMGSADNISTQVAALRNVYGDSSKLNAKMETGRREPFTDQGGSSGTVANTERTDGSPKFLTGSQRDYYQGMIDKGLYSGWDDPNVKSELGKYATRWKDRASA